jgi:hypothetical protein
VRRDWLPHRSGTVVTLGNISMAMGGLALCTGGISALVSVPLGITAWALAQHDLAQMQRDLMDPRGRKETEAGRTGGILGAVLGLVFGAFYAIIYLKAWF